MRYLEFVLGNTNGRSRRDSNATISSAVTGIFTSLYPSFFREIIYTDVVKPCVEEVLSSNDEETVGGYRRQVRITSAGHVKVIKRYIRRLFRQPVPAFKVEITNVAQDAKVFRIR